MVFIRGYSDHVSSETIGRLSSRVLNSDHLYSCLRYGNVPSGLQSRLVQCCETSVPPLWIVGASRVAPLDVVAPAPAQCRAAISLCVLRVADPMRTTPVAASTAAWRKTTSRTRSGLRGELLNWAGFPSAPSVPGSHLLELLHGASPPHPQYPGHICLSCYTGLPLRAHNTRVISA
jgi:hypothetical protein